LNCLVLAACILAYLTLSERGNFFQELFDNDCKTTNSTISLLNERYK
jgi:hypothetical protein